jgi:hypothetical protein
MLTTRKFPSLQLAGSGLLLFLGGFGVVIVIVWAAALFWLTAETMLSKL